MPTRRPSYSTRLDRNSHCCCLPPPLPDEESDSQNLVPRTPSLLRPRGCTDVCCLLLFILFWCGMLLISATAVATGDPSQIQLGRDWRGSQCGGSNCASHNGRDVCEDMTDRPYVYYPRLGADLAENPALAVSAPWSMPLYGLCVAECPSNGATVDDYACLDRGFWGGTPEGCKWESNPIARGESFGVWHVPVDTAPLLLRCLPLVESSTERTALCGYPDCTAAGRPCYTDAFPEQKLWVIASDADGAHCERRVSLEVTLTQSSADAGLVLQLVGGLFGGVVGVVGDLAKAQEELFVFGIVAAFVISLLWLFVLRHAIGCAFAVAVTAVLLLLTAADLYLFAKAGVLDLADLTSGVFNVTTAVWDGQPLRLPAEHREAAGQAGRAVTGWLDANAALDEVNQEHFLVAAWVCAGLLLGCVLLTIFLRHKLSVTMRICSHATRAVGSTPLLFVLPLATVVLSFMIVVLVGSVVMFAATPSPEAFAATFANLSSVDADLVALIEPQAFVWLSVGYLLFGGLWSLLFLEAIERTTICGATAYWFYVGSQPAGVHGVNGGSSSDDDERERFPTLNAFDRVFRFHLGTMALGSFLIALMKIPRAALAYLESQQKDPGWFAKFILKCTQWALWCFEQSLRYLTRFAYIHTATDGGSFCAGCVSTFVLLRDHGVQMAVNEAVLWLLVLLQSSLTPLCCALLAYISVHAEWRACLLDPASCPAIASWWPDGVPPLEPLPLLQDWERVGRPEPLYVGAAALVLSWWVTRLFQTVYAAAVDTIFVCCFSDAHHYGGRYASEELRAMVVSPPVGSPRLKGGKHGRSSFGEDDDDDGPVTRMI